MSSFEWNKIIASILTAMIIAMASGILASQLVRPKLLEKAVYLPEGAEHAATAGAQPGAAAGPVEAELPNNGMVVVEMQGGERVTVASRWKLNDPDPNKNWCLVAGQAAR